MFHLTLYAPPIQLGFYLLTSSKIHWFFSLRLMYRICVCVFVVALFSLIHITLSSWYCCYCCYYCLLLLAFISNSSLSYVLYTTLLLFILYIYNMYYLNSHRIRIYVRVSYTNTCFVVVYNHICHVNAITISFLNSSNRTSFYFLCRLLCCKSNFYGLVS